MIRATLVLRNVPKKQATDTAFKNISRADVGTPAAKPTATKAPDDQTMMPWNGWFSSFLKDKLGDEKYDKLRRLVLYSPDDNMGFEQLPRPNTKLGISEKDPNLTHQFRYPSPGSQPPVEQPLEDASFGNAGDDPYDSSYYKRDTGRRYTSEPGEGLNRDLEKIKLDLLPQDDPRVKEAMEAFEKGPGSSPGNKGVFALAKTDYDPTGLRASMSTSWEAAQKSLDDNMPDHLPTPVWMSKQAEIVAWYEERDLPVAIGGTGFGLVPKAARIARW